MGSRKTHGIDLALIRAVRLIWALVVFLLAGVAAVPDGHQGASSDSGPYVAVGGGGALHTPTDVPEGIKYTPPFGFVFRGDVGYRFSDVRVAAEGSYASFALGEAQSSPADSRASILAVMGTIWYDIPTGANSTVVPYVGVGVGLVVITASVGPLSASNTELGAQAGVGANFRVSPSLDVQLGYRALAPLAGSSLQIYHNAELGVLYRL